MSPAQKLTNRKFKNDRYDKMSWTRVAASGGFPFKHRCVCCPDLARKDDIVITVPVVREGKTVATAVIHQRCLAKFLEQVPDDHTVIRHRADNIMNRFRRKDDSI